MKTAGACGKDAALASPPLTADEPLAEDAGRFPLFAVTWAAAALFHTEYHWLAWREPALGPKLSALLVTVAAVATLRRPGPAALTALAAAEVLDVAVLLPEVPNHWLLAGLVSLAWLLGRAAGTADGETLLARVRAPVMVGVALFYLWTGFWKLNADFLRPEVSCAIVSWERVLGFLAWLPDAGALRQAVIWGTLGLELVGPPLLLCAPGTRRLLVPLLLLFHVGLGLDVLKHYLNFSSVMFALLLLYLPDAAVARLRDLYGERAARLVRPATLAYLVLIAAGVIAGAGSPLYWIGRWFLWLPYAVGLSVAVALACALAPADARRLPPGARGSLAWLFPVLVMLNGICPLLGLKTRTSWQMYSNIRLEADASNHFLVSRSLDLLGALRDRVTVVATSAEKMTDFVGTGLDLPWIEFRRRMRAAPEASVTWERGGTRRTVARVAEDPVLAAPLSFGPRKLWLFRPLGPGVVERCEW